MRGLSSIFLDILVATLVICFAVTAFGQTAGKIAGTVTDQGTGDGLAGANVVIVGTTYGASADSKGRYFILNVPPGTYSVRASFIGYEATVIENVQTSVGLTSEVNFALKTSVVEGEELVVTAAAPLVEKTLTASQTTVGTSELNNTLPVQSIEEIIETTPSVFRGYIRGGRKYETKTLIDGINISDTYFSGGTGGNQVIQTYTQVRRSEGDETNVVDVNAQSVQELDVLAGTFSAEYDAATAGVINITTKSGGSKLAGKVFLRSSVGGLNHAGPDVYNDLDRFLQEKADLAASGDPANEEKASLMTFDKATIDDIGYGDDVAFDGELSLGGPLGNKGNFYYTGRFQNNHGRFPGEFNREITNSLKLNYNLGSADRLTGNLIVNDGGILGGWKNRQFSQRYKFFPQGNPQNEKLGLVGYLTWTKTLSSNTFFEIRGSYTGRTSRFGYSDDNNDGIIERGEDGDFLQIKTAEQSLRYLGDAGSGTLTDANGNTVRTFFTGDPGNERFHDVAYSNGQYRFGQPGFYYEELKRNALQLKGDITSQVTFNHQLKGGFLYRRHSVDDFQQRTQVRVIFDPNFPFEETTYNVNPTQFAAYLQDRIEYKGIIINAGVRIDGFDVGADQFGNFFNVAIQDTLENGRIVRRENRTKDTSTDWFFGPRVGISHPITDNAAMHYSWGRFFSPPPFAELFENFGVISNPSLPQLRDVEWKPAESTAYEIGLQWEFITDYVVNATAYYRDIKNYSTTSYAINPAAGQGFGSYTYLTSFGYADARGLEVSLQKRPLGWLSGRLSYAFSYIKAARNASNISANKNSFSAAADSTIPFDDRDQWNTYSANVNGGGNPLESGFDREHRFALTFLVDLPYDIDVTGISTAESGFWYNVTQTSDDPREREQRRAPWSYRTDVRISKGFNLGSSRRGRIFLEGRNIFDTENILSWDNYNIASTALWEEKEDPTGDLNRATRNSGLSLYDIAREFYAGVDLSF